MHTIHAGYNGADGVDLADVDGDGRMDVTCGFEQGGIVSVSLQPPLAQRRAPWPTVHVGKNLYGVEDAVFADVDGDGHLDVISACECRKVTIHFAPSDPKDVLVESAWTSVTIAASVNVQRWMKLAFVDIDGDGKKDIVAGGRVSPASIGWFKAGADPRDGAGYTYTTMSEAGWTMSVVPRDVDGDGDADIVMSDKLVISYPDGSRRYDLRGTRWLENQDAGQTWVNHAIGYAVGGEHRFLSIVDFDGDGTDDVLDGASAAGDNRTFFRKTARSPAWCG